MADEHAAVSEKPTQENIERAREARQEAFRLALAEAGRASDAASSITFAMASESGRGWDPDAHLIPIAEALAAAEERGRRCGLEEARSLVGFVRHVQALLADGYLEGACNAIRALREKDFPVLAPRDSGKVIASGHAEETDREDRRDDRWANPDLEDRK